MQHLYRTDCFWNNDKYEYCECCLSSNSLSTCITNLSPGNDYFQRFTLNYIWLPGGVQFLSDELSEVSGKNIRWVLKIDVLFMFVVYIFRNCCLSSSYSARFSAEYRKSSLRNWTPPRGVVIWNVSSCLTAVSPLSKPLSVATKYLIDIDIQTFWEYHI